MGAAVETQGMEARMSIRLIAYLSATALVLYGMSLFLFLLLKRKMRCY